MANYLSAGTRTTLYFIDLITNYSETRVYEISSFRHYLCCVPDQVLTFRSLLTCAVSRSELVELR